MAANETLLTVILAGLAVYFLVLLGRGLSRYLLFLRVRPTALLTWPMRRPPHLRLLILMGAVSGGVAVLNGLMARPLHHVVSQALIAAYFVLIVPLLTRIQPGLYRDGVWAEDAFLPYAKIGRIAFREAPEIELILLPRGRSRALRLTVPPEDYSAVRKVLEQKKREGAMPTQERILGL